MSQVNESVNKEPLPDIKMYQDIVDRAHSEVKSVREVYKWLCVALGTIISTGVGCAVFLTYSSIREMRTNLESQKNEIRSQMKQEIEIIKLQARQDYLLLATDLKLSLRNSIQNTEGKVNARIDSEFNRENIQDLVRSTAQQRIDSMADVIIDSQIQKKISPKIKVVDTKLSDLDMSANFILVASAAQNDDKSSFLQLNRWANDNNYPMRAKAKQVLDHITSKANTNYLVASNEYPWKPGFTPEKLNLTELKKEYLNNELSVYKTNLLSYIHSRDDIAKKDKLSFYLNVITIDKSLEACSTAAYYFQLLSGQNFPTFFDPSLYKDWLEKYAAKTK